MNNKNRLFGLDQSLKYSIPKFPIMEGTQYFYFIIHIKKKEGQFIS